MLSLFFGLQSKAKTRIDSRIIEVLTAFRLSGYNVLNLHTVSSNDYLFINQFIEELGIRILKANILKPVGLTEYKQAEAKFLAMLSGFLNNTNDTFPRVYYAAQLLQYFTLLCDNSIPGQQSFPDFHRFLSDNLIKYGDTGNNVFVIEYKLIKIYNDLCVLTDFIAEEASIPQNIERQSAFLANHLLDLHTMVTQFTCDAPDNVFACYLYFVSHYATAKLLELQYRLKKDGEHDALADAQQSHLSAALAALEKINRLPSHHQEIGNTHLPGAEFSFGQSILGKLPVSDINEIRDHITSLLQPKQSSYSAFQ